MRRDLIIGTLVSCFVIGGLGWGETAYGKIRDALFGPKKTVAAPQTSTVEVEIWEAPEMPEVPPDPTDAADEEPAVDVATIAPPSLMDVPGNVQVDSFTQQMQPPPPPSLGRPDGGTMTIPKGPPGSGVKNTMGAIFDLKDLDQRPTPRGMRAEPQYPYEMKRQGIPGEVILQFLVDERGDVRDVTVTRSSHREFEAPAIQAVQKWKFRPGKKGGKAVITRMQIPIAFNLNDDE
ncbi:protein TonB [Ereboglobus sp. PH5-5]|uniref:energy transducer TonB n=1 Tax=Ereboglobus sp. PH5-5 TaxID=2940529 RepID=UPI0024068B54|nr:energy transducer TonB [Ereboglobus sp. PH5-5]MDF9834138.1 protein TonB [Ereboglobus sp. PH5-5]